MAVSKMVYPYPNRGNMWLTNPELYYEMLASSIESQLNAEFESGVPYQSYCVQMEPFQVRFDRMKQAFARKKAEMEKEKQDEAAKDANRVEIVKKVLEEREEEMAETAAPKLKLMEELDAAQKDLYATIGKAEKLGRISRKDASALRKRQREDDWSADAAGDDKGKKLSKILLQEMLNDGVFNDSSDSNEDGEDASRSGPSTTSESLPGPSQASAPAEPGPGPSRAIFQASAETEPQAGPSWAMYSTTGVDEAEPRPGPGRAMQMTSVKTEPIPTASQSQDLEKSNAEPEPRSQAGQAAVSESADPDELLLGLDQTALSAEPRKGRSRGMKKVSQAEASAEPTTRRVMAKSTFTEVKQSSGPKVKKMTSVEERKEAPRAATTRKAHSETPPEPNPDMAAESTSVEVKAPTLAKKPRQDDGDADTKAASKRLAEPNPKVATATKSAKPNEAPRTSAKNARHVAKKAKASSESREPSGVMEAVSSSEPIRVEGPAAAKKPHQGSKGLKEASDLGKNRNKDKVSLPSSKAPVLDAKKSGGKRKVEKVPFESQDSSGATDSTSAAPVPTKKSRRMPEKAFPEQGQEANGIMTAVSSSEPVNFEAPAADTRKKSSNLAKKRKTKASSQTLEESEGEFAALLSSEPIGIEAPTAAKKKNSRDLTKNAKASSEPRKELKRKLAAESSSEPIGIEPPAAPKKKSGLSNSTKKTKASSQALQKSTGEIAAKSSSQSAAPKKSGRLAEKAKATSQNSSGNIAAMSSSEPISVEAPPPLSSKRSKSRQVAKKVSEPRQEASGGKAAASSSDPLEKPRRVAKRPSEDVVAMALATLCPPEPIRVDAPATATKKRRRVPTTTTTKETSSSEPPPPSPKTAKVGYEYKPPRTRSRGTGSSRRDIQN